MPFKSFARSWLIDLLAGRDDRCYWRQPRDAQPLPQNATVLLWQPDGKLGDAVVHARFLHDLVQQRPDLKVHIACDAGLVAFWQALPGVVKAHVATASAQRSNLVQALKGCGAFISFETFLSLETVRMVRALRPQRCMGFSVAPYRLFDDALVDTTYAFPRRHVSDRLRHLAEVLQLDHLGHSAVADTTRTLAGAASGTAPPARTGKVVFLNTYAAAADRSFSAASVTALLEAIAVGAPGARVVVSLPADQTLGSLQNAHSTLTIEALAPGRSIWQLLGTIDACDVVVTPDTAIGHLGAALDKPVIVAYRDRHYNPVVWRPLASRVTTLLPQQVGDINSFDLATAQEAIARALA